MYKKYFQKRKIVFAAGATVICATLISRYFGVLHWYSLDWNITGYTWFHPILWLATGIAILVSLHVRKIKAIEFWVLGITSIIYTVISMWVIWF